MSYSQLQLLEWVWILLILSILFISHHYPPLESYVQEIGRAGRSGNQSYATLYYNKFDINKSIKTVDETVKIYCEEDGCLRKFIISYFGFNYSKPTLCCSNCNPQPETDANNTQIELVDIDRDIFVMNYRN